MRGFPAISRVYDQGPTPRSDVQIRQDTHDLRTRAWREQGIAVLDPEDINDDWLRQALINEANRKYGRRGRHGGSVDR